MNKEKHGCFLFLDKCRHIFQIFFQIMPHNKTLGNPVHPFICSQHPNGRGMGGVMVVMVGLGGSYALLNPQPAMGAVNGSSARALESFVPQQFVLDKHNLARVEDSIMGLVWAAAFSREQWYMTHTCLPWICGNSYSCLAVVVGRG